MKRNNGAELIGDARMKGRLKYTHTHARTSRGGEGKGENAREAKEDREDRRKTRKKTKGRKIVRMKHETRKKGEKMNE